MISLRIAGAVLVIVALLGACADRPEPTAGATDAARLASAAPPTSSSPSPSPAVVVPPAQLRIAKLGLTARTDAVGIDSKGDFAVPPSIDVVGWYRFGPGLEATAGSIVVAGHVDSADQGKGAFFRLRELAQGDEITVTGADGKNRVFTVVAREIFAKTAVPLERYFARDGAVRLTLITCGGPFDPKTRHYRDNVVITAQPVER